MPMQPLCPDKAVLAAVKTALDYTATGNASLAIKGWDAVIKLVEKSAEGSEPERRLMIQMARETIRRLQQPTGAVAFAKAARRMGGR